jgi:hypothetical protein
MFNNTLYTYTSEAFQSLPLQKGAEWSELPMGVAVTGGVCVKSTPKNNTAAAALYIVGGTANSTDYPGLQRFTFANGTWETIHPTVAVTQNRLWHNAVYLNTSDTILVYAGSQDGSQHPSSQTFTIQASEPYTVLAYEAIAPPAINPLLMQWTESKAIFIGGGESNTKAMIFSPSLSWVDSNATLAAPLYSTSSVKAIVINGDDGSKNIYTFDMSTSPNGVNRTILIDADGNPVQNAKPIVETRQVNTEVDERSVQLVERENLTVDDWPVYNDTFAPSSTRTSYAICADQSGLVVISGGNEEDVLCMFKARDNCWVNATAVLGTKVATVQGIGAAPTTASSASQSATSTGAAKAGESPFPVKILGAVLGSIILVAIILVAILALFRWRKRRRQYNDAGHQRRSSGIPNEKDNMDFADRGYPQMSSARQYLGHEPQSSQGSFSSMAILMGRYGHKRGDKANGSLGSDSSSQFNKKYKTAISKPIPQEQPMTMRAGPARQDKGVSFAAPTEEAAPTPKPRASTRGGRRGSTRRSSGWNRYWSGGSAMNILGFGSKRTTYEGSDRSSDSHYSEQRLPSQITQVSAVPMPLKLGDGRPELNRVMSGSPTIAYHARPLTREMSGTIERPGSTGTMSSFNDDRNDAFSSGVPASVHEQNTWTPIEQPAWGSKTAPSNYSESVYATTLHQSTAPNFPPPAPPQRQPAQQPSDMSWLNLGGNTRI